MIRSVFYDVGIRLHALEAGPEDGPVALLLHGFPEGAESWRYQLQALASLGFRAVAPDMRGYGQSDAPAGVEQYRLLHLVEDIRRLVAGHLGGQVHLSGHDWGALVAWSFTSRHPGLVRQLAALSVGHPHVFVKLAGSFGAEPDEDQVRRSWYIQLFQDVERSTDLLLADDAERLRSMYSLGPAGPVIPDEMVHGFVRGFMRPGRMAAALSYYAANLNFKAFTRWPPCPLPIVVPVLLVKGEEDPAVGPRSASETAAEVAGPFHLELLPGAGHWLQHERPQIVAELLQQHFRGGQLRTSTGE